MDLFKKVNSAYANTMRFDASPPLNNWNIDCVTADLLKEQNPKNLTNLLMKSVIEVLEKGTNPKLKQEGYTFKLDPEIQAYIWQRLKQSHWISSEGIHRSFIQDGKLCGSPEKILLALSHILQKEAKKLEIQIKEFTGQKGWLLGSYNRWDVQYGVNYNLITQTFSFYIMVENHYKGGK